METFQLLDEDRRINSHVPETRIMTEENVSALLKKYEALILKPAAGSGGRGIINIWSEKNDSFLVQVKSSKEVVAKKELYSCVAGKILKGFSDYMDSEEAKKILAKTYIVQHRIPLTEIDLCPFDIRVMVQRKGDLPWKVTGRLVKLASFGFAITNVNLGATILPVETALQHSPLRHLPQETLIFQLDQVALLATERIQQHDPRIQVIGFDMGFDSLGNVWIIEANNAPDDYIFLDLEDKTMYETILAYR